MRDVLSQTLTRKQLGKPAGPRADMDKLTAVAVPRSVEAANEMQLNFAGKELAFDRLKADVAMLSHINRFPTLFGNILWMKRKSFW